MKKLAKNVKEMAAQFWKDEEAQGMMEYILLAVVVVGAVTLVGPKIRRALDTKTDELAGSIGSFDANQ